MLASPASQPPEATEQLIEGCLKGDQHAWALIVARYRPKVFNVAYKFVGRHDLAEDLTQDVFLKIFKALGTFDRRANFHTWLISVSRNLCIDHYRSVRKEREMVDRSIGAADVSPVSTEPDALVTLESGDRRAMLYRALARLPDTLRAAVLLRDIQELSYQEIADLLALPEGTVKSRINRGRKELARQIQRVTVDAETIGADDPS
jgi:RNA polymerase sigma-70 factor (ECF subfamily)